MKVDIKGHLCRVAASVLAFLVLVTLVIYGVSIRSCKDSQTASSAICLNESCVKAAGDILLSMDPTADPCMDFYQYTCGGWESRHKPRREGDSVSMLQLRQDLLHLHIKEILDSTNPLNANLPISVRDAVSFYLSCASHQRHPSPAETSRVLDGVMNWPLTNDTWREVDFEWTQVVGRSLRHLSDGAGLVRVGVKLHELDNSRHVLTLSSGPWAYAEVMADSGEVEWYVDKVLGNRSAGHDRMVTEMMGLYARLQQISPPSISTTDVHQIKNNFRSLKEMTNMTGVDWTAIVRAATTSEHLDLNITEDEEVFWEDVGYFVELVKLLERTPKRTVANLLGWNLLSIYTYNPSLLLSYPRNARQLAALPTVDTFDQCLGLLAERYNFPLLHLLLLGRYRHLRDKRPIQEMVESIKTAFMELINESTWLNKKMKKRAEMKVKSLIPRLGYPGWIVKDKSLDDFYKEASNLTYRFREDLINNAKFIRVKNLQKLRQVNSRRGEWPIWVEASSVNGIFSQLENMMVLPLAILTDPFINKDLPAYLNYGSLGTIIGHEMTHALDSNGKERDPRGNLADWWDGPSRRAYDRLARCFASQYNQYYYKEAKAFVNGSLTLNENLADSGGVRHAFRAYTTWEKSRGPEPRLPTFHNFTSAQMFFIRYGMNWCHNLGSLRLRQELRINPHTIGRHRLNGALSNLPEFWKTFSCKPGSSMVNDDICTLW